jgi:hypothetical protein
VNYTRSLFLVSSIQLPGVGISCGTQMAATICVLSTASEAFRLGERQLNRGFATVGERKKKIAGCAQSFAHFQCG